MVGLFQAGQVDIRHFSGSGEVMNGNDSKRPSQRFTQWVRGGGYAVAVEVEGIVPPEDPSVRCLNPGTVRYLEKLTERAAAGDLEELRKAGTVYVKMS